MTKTEARRQLFELLGQGVIVGDEPDFEENGDVSVMIYDNADSIHPAPEKLANALRNIMDSGISPNVFIENASYKKKVLDLMDEQSVVTVPNS